MTSAFSRARHKFLAAVVEHYRSKGASNETKIYPLVEKKSDPYGELETPPYYVFRADLPPNPFGIRGFASAEGAVFLAIDKASLGPFLGACRLLDPERSLSASQVAKRLAWAYPGFGIVIEKPDDHPFAIAPYRDKGIVKPPAILRHSDGSASVIYWTIVAQTPGGAESLYRLDARLEASGQAALNRQHASEVAQ